MQDGYSLWFFRATLHLFCVPQLPVESWQMNQTLLLTHFYPAFSLQLNSRQMNVYSVSVCTYLL